MTASARVMVPIQIVRGMLKTGTSIPEPDTSKGEVAWVSGANNTNGLQRTYSGSVYVCKKAHTGSTATPDVDEVNWFRDRPTNRMAPFDDYANTKAVGTGSVTYVMQPGFFNAVAVYGLEGSAYSLIVRDGPAGAIIRQESGDLFSQAAGFYELMFAPLVPMTQLSFDDIPLSPLAEVSLTVTSAPGQRAAVGTIKVGDWRQFIGESRKGGAQYGAEAERRRFTLRKYNSDGTYTTVRRPSSRNVSCTILVDTAQAMYADSILDEIDEVAVPFEATGLPHYGYLNTLGFVTASIRAADPGTASINLKVEGNT